MVGFVLHVFERSQHTKKPQRLGRCGLHYGLLPERAVRPLRQTALLALVLATTTLRHDALLVKNGQPLMCEFRITGASSA